MERAYLMLCPEKRRKKCIVLYILYIFAHTHTHTILEIKTQPNLFHFEQQMLFFFLDLENLFHLYRISNNLYQYFL